MKQLDIYKREYRASFSLPHAYHKQLQKVFVSIFVNEQIGAMKLSLHILTSTDFYFYKMLLKSVL